jgi:ribosomal protein S6
MKKINETNNYELMVVVSSECTETELKNIAFNYAQELKKLGAVSISVVSRGRRDFAYITKKIKTGYFVEIYFNSSPQVLPIYETKLKLDKNVIRSLLSNVSAR